MVSQTLEYDRFILSMNLVVGVLLTVLWIDLSNKVMNNGYFIVGVGCGLGALIIALLSIYMTLDLKDSLEDI